MAKQMSYTDPNTGAVYPASVWIPMNPNPDFSVPSGSVCFNGYATLELASLALKHSFGIPGGRFVTPIKQYLVPLSADQVRAIGSAAPVGPNMITALSIPAYEAEAVYLTVPAPTQEDPDRKVSFFANATDVVVPLS